MITYDSNFAITVTKKNEKSIWVRKWDINSTREVFAEEFLATEICKLKEIEQNDEGNYFAAAYYDTGVFKIRTFDGNSKHANLQRTDEEIAMEELNVNEIIGVDDHTRSIFVIPESFITCTFVNHDRLFVNLFNNY